MFANPFPVTFFFDHQARQKRQELVTCAELAQRIAQQTAAEKRLLPWLKLAVFSGNKSRHGSLRHDANVLAVTGCEADYDGEIMGFDEAVARLENAGIAAIVYTSPSHRPDKPRWRIVCPFSQELKPLHRATMLARLNGLFDGVFGPESFTLSQSYYYGSLDNDEARGNHRVRVIEGRAIDLATELEAKSLGKNRMRATSGNGGARPPQADLRELTRRILAGESLHPSVLSIAGRFAKRGLALEDTLDYIGLAFTAASTDRYDGRWSEVERAARWCYEQEEAKRNGKASPVEPPPIEPPLNVTIDDFHAYMPQHKYICVPTREIWVEGGIDGRLSKRGDIKASTWLDRNKPVEQITWAPGEPMLIKDRIISQGGFCKQPGYTCFNLYKPPVITGGDPLQAGPWIDHIRFIYPNEADHIIRWFAQRVQTPHIKINHALLLGGAMGIGKDTMIEPVKRAVGAWNCEEVTPQQVMGRFNGFVKSVILRISEARDLGEVNRYQFYDHMKAITAAPPDVIRVDEKNLREYSVPNCCGVIITTNHKADGIFLPADDRRHFVAWSLLKKEDFEDRYWEELWWWIDHGGDAHVAAYLKSLDLSGFNPKAPPPKTKAFWDIVDASKAPEDAEMRDVIEQLNNPKALTLDMVRAKATGEFLAYLNDRRNRRQIPHRFESCGYAPVHNDDAEDGHWKIAGKRQTVYAVETLTHHERIAAVRWLAGQRGT